MASAGLIDDTKQLLDHTNELLLDLIDIKPEKEPEMPKTEPVNEAKKASE